MIWFIEDSAINSTTIWRRRKMPIVQASLSILSGSTLPTNIRSHRSTAFNSDWSSFALDATRQLYAGKGFGKLVAGPGGVLHARRDLPFSFFGSVLNYRNGIPISGGPIAPANGSPESLSFSRLRYEPPSSEWQCAASLLRGRLV